MSGVVDGVQQEEGIVDSSAAAFAMPTPSAATSGGQHYLQSDGQYFLQGGQYYLQAAPDGSAVPLFLCSFCNRYGLVVGHTGYWQCCFADCPANNNFDGTPTC
jgi:hypothetical protein